MPTLDPTPRKYPSFVWLVRRMANGPAAAPAKCDSDEIEAWLLGEAARERDMLALFERLVWRLRAAGLPLDRASLHVGTLHPQAFGYAWTWNARDGICDEVRVTDGAHADAAYLKNPLRRVIDQGVTIRRRIDDPAARAEFPLMAELAESGLVEYLALPIGGGEGYHNAATVATARPDGFTAAELATIRRLLALFGLHVERHIAWRIAGNVLDAYLGGLAGQRVLRGAIRRGKGEPIEAVIWISDLRGYTELSDRLPGPDMVALLDSYFEILAGAVLANGGEVLKFIGDGLLAVFPLNQQDGARAAAGRALEAAEQAAAALSSLNEGTPPPPLDRISGWRPLRTGIALHEGQVFFGNIGAPERLDFTVIGPAVNIASRVEALCKPLGRTILVTEPVARRLDRNLHSLGRHQLKGVAEPIEIWSPD